MGATKDIVSSVLRLGNHARHLKVKVSDDEFEQSQILDLLAAKLVLDRPITSAAKGRHARARRWNALRSAYNEWLQNDVFD